MGGFYVLWKRNRSEGRWIVAGEVQRDFMVLDAVSPQFAAAVEAASASRSFGDPGTITAEEELGLEPDLPGVVSSGKRQWKRINVLGIFFALLALPAWAWFYTLMHPLARGFGNTWAVGIEFGLLAAVPIYGLAVSIGLLRLPTSFFEKEVAGRRVMRFVGAKSASGVQPIALFCVMLCLGCLVGAVCMTVFVFR